MSGIFGYVNWSGTRPEASVLNRMGDFLTHLPDYQLETFNEESVQLGLISPVRGWIAPIFKDPASERIYIFDGVLTNYCGTDDCDQFSLLRWIGRRFDQEGPDSVSGLAGEFNLVVIDARQKKCWLMTDRYAFRRMYYFVSDDTLIFAPEVKAILVANESAGKNKDEAALADYFNYGYPLGEKTFFRSIRVLNPGSWLEFSPEGSRQVRYWHFIANTNPESISFDRAVERTKELWLKAIQSRLPGDSYRPGCALSGGLDSRLIACTASQYRSDLQAYTYGQNKCLDVRIASIVAGSLNLSHHVVDISPDCFGRYADRAIWLTEGMAYVPNAMQLSTYPSIRNLFDIHLSGFAGDLTLGGSFIQPENLNRIADEEEIVDNFVTRMAQFSTDRFLNSIFIKDYSEFIRKRLRNSISEELVKANYNGLTLNQIREDFFINQHCRRYINQISLQKYFCTDRKPFFDYDLMDYTFSLPEEYRLAHRLFFSIFRDLYPVQAGITWQKTGGNCYHEASWWNKFLRRMEQPAMYYVGRLSRGRWNPIMRSNYEHYNQWYRKDPRQQRQMAEVLLDPQTLRRGYFRREGIEELLRLQMEGGIYFYRLAALYNFEMWHRLFLTLNPGSHNPWKGSILS